MTIDQTYIPLSESTFLILVSLAAHPKHGYAIAKDIQDLSDSRVILSVSTLYTTLKRLLEDGLIERSGEAADLDESGRPRKTYALTDQGRRMLSAETARLRSLLAVAKLRGVEV